MMDTSFANQALSLVHLMTHDDQLKNQVHKVPMEIIQRIATLRLQVMGLSIHRLTDEQQAYLSSSEEGT